MIYKLSLYPCGAPKHCTCEVGLNDETGEIILPDLNLCVFTKQAHDAAIERAKEQLENLRKGKR